MREEAPTLLGYLYPSPFFVQDFYAFVFQNICHDLVNRAAPTSTKDMSQDARRVSIIYTDTPSQLCPLFLSQTVDFLRASVFQFQAKHYRTAKFFLRLR